jgi:hypothetical protein
MSIAIFICCGGWKLEKFVIKGRGVDNYQNLGVDIRKYRKAWNSQNNNNFPENQ